MSDTRSTLRLSARPDQAQARVQSPVRDCSSGRSSRIVEGDRLNAPSRENVADPRLGAGRAAAPLPAAHCRGASGVTTFPRARGGHRRTPPSHFEGGPFVPPAAPAAVHAHRGVPDDVAAHALLALRLPPRDDAAGRPAPHRDGSRRAPDARPPRRHAARHRPAGALAAEPQARGHRAGHLRRIGGAVPGAARVIRASGGPSPEGSRPRWRAPGRAHRGHPLARLSSGAGSPPPGGSRS
jgi:hypothetical protein